MCQSQSWYELYGRYYWLINEHLSTKKGKELIVYVGNTIDLQGHGAIQSYFGQSFELPLQGGIKHELTDLRDPSSLPLGLIEDIKNMKMVGVWSTFPKGLLTSKAQEKYITACSEARKKCDTAWSEAWEKCDTACSEARKKCDTARSEAWEKCNTARSEAFWALFEDPKNRTKAWR